MPPTSPYDVVPEAALAAIQTHCGPILVDLDETLYLRNSTEDFIDSAYPQLLARGLMKVLDWTKPWRLTGGHETRDVWRLAFIRILFPWTMWVWQTRVTQLATSLINKPLHDALRVSTQQIIVVTVGFKPVVTKLIKAMGFESTQIVAARPWSFADRRNGKLVLAQAALPDAVIASALLITDSIDDAPLLQRCAMPLRVLWPNARYRPALSCGYFPGEYLTKIKRPGERYIWRAIVQEDLALWILSSVPLAAHITSHIFGLSVLMISFWAIYECGYVDNDLIAAHFEKEPQLSATYGYTEIDTSIWKPWLWALLLGAIGVTLLRWPGMATAMDYLKWLGALLATHGCFRLYNRLDKRTRAWLYVWLQLARSAAFAVLVPITTIGATALGSNTLARWIPYYIYRHVGQQWPGGKPAVIRIVIFALLASLMIAAQGLPVVDNWSTVALVAWSVFRARHELRSMTNHIERLDRPTS